MKKVSYLLSLLIITLMCNSTIFACASGEWEGIYTDYYFDPDLKSTPPFADFILEKYFPNIAQIEEGDGDWIVTPGSGQTAYDDFVEAVELDSRLTEEEKEKVIALRGQCHSHNSYALIADTLCGWSFIESLPGACEDFRQGNYEKVLEAYDAEIKKTESSYSKEVLLEKKSKIEAFIADENNLLFNKANQSHGYGLYVNVVQLFLNGHYQKALENIRLVKLIEAPKWYDKVKFWEHKTDWLYQTACYMEARLLLIISQEKWSGYEPDETIDRELLMKAENHFDDYLKKFPQGLYAETAHNIHRFIYRLARDQKSLTQALVSDLKTAVQILRADPDDEIKQFKFREILREVERFSREVVDYDSADPIGIAHNVLSVSPGKLKEIEAQKEKFKPYPGLYDLVWVWSAYQHQEYEKVVQRKIDATSPVSSVIAFIQARALRILKRYDDALSMLRESLKAEKKDYIQAEVLCIYSEMRKGYAQFFLEPLSDEILKDTLMYSVEDVSLEDWLLNERDRYPDRVLSLMASELMTRYLVQGKMQDAMKLLNALPDGVVSQYDNIRPAIDALVKNPHDMTAMLQMGVYLHESVQGIQLLDIEDYYYGEPNLAPIMCERCNVCKACAVSQAFDCKEFHEKRHAFPTYPPYYYYKKVVDHFEKTKKKDNLEAEALHFLSICGKGHSTALQCTWGHEDDFRKEVDVKKMFQILHKKYKGSTWANETPYYY